MVAQSAATFLTYLSYKHNFGSNFDNSIRETCQLLFNYFYYLLLFTNKKI